MARREDADVDPRFDPVFQRGYDPVQHGRSRRQASSSQGAGATAPAADVRPLTPPPAYRSADPPVIDARDSAGPTGAAEGVVVTTPEREDDEPAPPRANPFRVLLLLASIAAIAGAGALFWRRIEADPYSGGYGPDLESTFAYQFTDALMVPLLTGGLLGVCLWLALGALRRRDHD